MRRSALLRLVVASLPVLAVACKVEAHVAVDVDEDGSGVVEVTVELDPDAARRLGDPATAVRVDDLSAAGWDVDAPNRAEDGSVAYVARREFAGPDQLPVVLDEVGGEDGVFSGVRLRVDDGFGATTYDIAATVELTGSPEQFSDAELAAALDGLPLARSPEELAQAGAADPDAMALEVSVSLPGGHTETWSFPVTGGEPTSEQLAAHSTVTRGRTRVLAAVAVVALLAAAATAVVGFVRRPT